jgi:PleD family two-component response regulator
MDRMSRESPARKGGITRLLRKRESVERAEPESEQAAPGTIDPETGLGNGRALYDHLRREIARSRRFGDRSCLVVFDVRVVGYQPTAEAPLPPSPAGFVARSLTETARDTDVVTRLDATHFVVLLSECDRNGARLFAERARTRIASLPYQRDGATGHLYARAWAGFASWEPSIAGPDEYLAAAMAEFERTRPHYEMAQLWFTGAIS